MPTGTTEKRMALVIGNSKYGSVPALKNPGNDAAALGQKLIELGFDVRTEIDASSDQMIRAVGAFTQALAEATEQGQSTSAVLFYAGHGVQVEGENYLLPIDAEVRSKLDLQHRCVSLHLVLEALGAAARNSVVFLDCCRDNPLPRTLGPATRSLAQGQGLADVRAPKGVYIAYATQPHFVALDGTGNNSPFTEALLDFIDDTGKHVTDVMMDVRRAVHDKTKGQQVPWDHSALFEPFRFVPGDASKLEGLTPDQRERVLQEEATAREDSYWKLIPQTRDVGFIHSFVTQFPNSRHRAAALARIDELKQRSQFWRVMRLASVAFAALLVVAAIAQYSRATRLNNFDIASDDIDVEVGDLQDVGLDRSRFGCWWYCLFKSECIAFSYDRTPAAADATEPKKRCFPKSGSAWGLPIQGIYTEVFPGYPRPVRSEYFLKWDRVLVGGAVDQIRVSELKDAPPRQARYDEGADRPYFAVKSASDCEKLCTLTSDVCKGFSYARVSGRCEVFNLIKNIAKDTDGNEIHVPSTVSGCRDPKDCITIPVSRAPTPAKK